MAVPAPTAVVASATRQRLSPGTPQSVPPAWLPLSFLVAAGIGLVGFGVTFAANSDVIVHSPTSPAAVATVHMAMLAFLSMAVLGAAHQFGPVVSGRSLRNPWAGLATLVLFAPAAWLLPLAFATRQPRLLEVAGVTAFVAICIAAWNLSGPLSVRGRGTSVAGLRLAVIYLVTVALFGVTYAFDRSNGWFLLLPRRVLAHAHIGLLGWLGLAYVAVAEKLWPMFLLAHRPSVKAGEWAVRLLAGGVPVVVTGLLIPFEPITLVGAALCAAGLGAHLVSLSTVISHRRRKLELLHFFVLAAAASLVIAGGAAALAGAPGVTTLNRLRAVQVEVAALTMWLSLAIIGHLHKIVPFIGWSRMRAAGHTRSLDDKPLMFAHLVHQPTAWATFVLATGGALAAIVGLGTAQPVLVRISGIALALTGVAVSANLISGPLRIVRADNRRAAATAPAASADAIPVATDAATDAAPLTPISLTVDAPGSAH